MMTVILSSSIRTRCGRSHQRATSALLLGRADQHLVDRDVTWPGDDELDGLGDVSGRHPFDAAEALLHRLLHLGPVVRGQLGLDRAGLDQGDTYVASGHL